MSLSTYQASSARLDQILTRAGPLKAAFTTDGEVLKKAQIYLAPPGRHLLVDRDRVSLGHGLHENNAKPAVDPILRSAAICCGGRGVGVVLTGRLGYGASGLWALKEAGGIAVIQDPRDAAFPEMPETARSRLQPDHVVHLGAVEKVLAG